MALGTTAALIQSIRRHTHIPATHPSFTDALTLADATEELHSYLLPLGLAQRQELWAGPVGRVRVPVVNGQAAYDVPSRAAGTKLRAARLLDSQGHVYPLNYYGREEAPPNARQTGMPTGLAFEGATVRFDMVPQGLSGYVLEMDTYLRPAELVEASQAGVITSVTVGEATTTVLFNGVGDITAAEFVDIVNPRPPFDTRSLESLVIAAENTSGTEWEFVLDGVLDAEEGDYVCLPGTAPVVQAPLEWHPLLALKVATRQLASLGDMQAAQAKGGEGQQKEGQAATLIRPRREDVPRKVRNGMDRWRGGTGGWGY